VPCLSETWQFGRAIAYQLVNLSTCYPFSPSSGSILPNDKNKQTKPGQKEKDTNAKSDQQKLNVKNPFNENDHKVITPHVEGEQYFKECADRKGLT